MQKFKLTMVLIRKIKKSRIPKEIDWGSDRGFEAWGDPKKYEFTK